MHATTGIPSRSSFNAPNCDVSGLENNEARIHAFEHARDGVTPSSIDSSCPVHLSVCCSPGANTSFGRMFLWFHCSFPSPLHVLRLPHPQARFHFISLKVS